MNRSRAGGKALNSLPSTMRSPDAVVFFSCVYEQMSAHAIS
jgi:hypothetical protein